MEPYIGTLIIFVLFALHWTASIIVQTIFLHRYAAHNLIEFKNTFVKRVAHFVTWLALGPSYLSPIAYGLMHSAHHMWPDEPNDPHSPEKGFWGFWRTMWRTAVVYRAFENGTDWRIKEIDKSRLPDLEDIRALDKLMQNIFVRLVWIVFYAGVYAYIYKHFGFNPILFALLLGHATMGPIHGAMVNYFAHIWGERPHKMKNTSTNLVPNWLVRFFLWGENEHNEHHYDPHSVKFGKGDLGFGLINILSKLGILKILPRKKSP